MKETKNINQTTTEKPDSMQGSSSRIPSSDPLPDWAPLFLDLLARAAQAAQDAIAARCPGDQVPDSIAIPRLNRLEAEAIRTEQAFDTVRAALQDLVNQ